MENTLLSLYLHENICCIIHPDDGQNSVRIEYSYFFIVRLYFILFVCVRFLLGIYILFLIVIREEKGRTIVRVASKTIILRPGLPPLLKKEVMRKDNH